MKLTSAELKSLYQEGTARSARGGVNCLTSEKMMRAAMGQLSEGEREQVADHLLSCSDCTREFRLVYALKPWAEKTGQALTESVEPGLHSDSTAPWLPLRAVEQSLPQRPALWQRIAAFFLPARPSFALAAQLVMWLTLLALAFWILMTRQENNSRIARLHEQLAERDRALDSTEKSLNDARRQLDETLRRAEENRSGMTSNQYKIEIARLRQTIAELSSPQLDIPIVDLDPGGAIRGGAKEAITLIEAPKTANLVTLILNFTGRQQYSGYVVEIFDQSGKQVWRGQIARRSQANSLNLTIARRLLPGGRYQIKLFGHQNGKIEPIADYPVTIRYI